MSTDSAPDSQGSGASSRPGDVVDLDALRAKRLEVAPSRVIRYGGREWSLVPEVPFVYAEMWRSGMRVAATKLLFAEEGDGDKFFELNPSGDDISEIASLYGTSAGES